MQRLHFIIPDPAGFVSGGNVYNRQLIAALIHAGAHVSHLPLNLLLAPASPQTSYLLDSLFFSQITDPTAQIPPGSLALVHHLDSLYPFSKQNFLERDKPLLQHFAGFIATSAFTAGFLEGHGFDPARICTIEPAPALAIRRTCVAGHTVQALMLGSCIPRKGVLPFLQALAPVQIASGYTLTIAGSLTADPAYAAACVDLIGHHPGLRSHVRLMGEVDQTTIATLYAESNCFVSASYMETFGMAIQDAVMCGLPVLALEGGFAAWHITEGINGQHCETMQDLVAEFQRCANDRGYFQSLQACALEYEPPYHTWDEAAAKLLEWLHGRGR